MSAALLALLAALQAPDAPVGTVSVEPADPVRLSPEIARIFDDAIERALGDAGFTPLPGIGHSRYVACFSIARSEKGAVATPTRKSGPTTDLGNWGAALSVELPSRKTQLSALVVTTLTVTILRRGDARPVWQGSALTAQADDSRAGDAVAVAQKLATSLISQYPARLAEPIPVP